MIKSSHLQTLIIKKTNHARNPGGLRSLTSSVRQLQNKATGIYQELKDLLCVSAGFRKTTVFTGL